MAVILVQMVSAALVVVPVRLKIQFAAVTMGVFLRVDLFAVEVKQQGTIVDPV